MCGATLVLALVEGVWKETGRLPKLVTKRHAPYGRAAVHPLRLEVVRRIVCVEVVLKAEESLGREILWGP